MCAQALREPRMQQEGTVPMITIKSGLAPGGEETASGSQPVPVGPVDIDGHACVLMRVSGVIPRHMASRRDARPRLEYVPGELVHFDLDGQRYALVPQQALPAAVCESEPGALPAHAHDLLTNRELQIVQLICAGLLTKQVADRLHISEFTVRSYLKTIYCKLGVRSRGAMVFRYAQAFRDR
jgi:DNA-binding CsgD family transcriptional regulator